MTKIIFIFLILKELSFGYINIYPTFFYEKISDKGVFKKFILTNKSNESVRYRLYLEENFLDDGIKVEIYPKSITLKPLEKKEIKVRLKSDNKNLNKEFSKKLIIKEIELPNQNKKIMTILKLKLSGFVGELSSKLSFIDETADFIKIKNIGNRTGMYDVFNLSNEYVDTIILKKDEEKKVKKEYRKFNYKEKFERADR